MRCYYFNGCLNGAALFSTALSEEECNTVKGYCQKIETTAENLLNTIVRLSAAKIRVTMALEILGNQKENAFILNSKLQALGISSWESYISRRTEAISSYEALTADLSVLNRAYCILFPSPGS